MHKTNNQDLLRAFRLADAADAITKKHYLSARLQVTTKPDKTPVTEADLAVERTLSTIVHEEFGDKYVGEENVRDARQGRHWVVDPIDGTKNFLRGMPIWATLIGLRDGDTTIANVVSAPALGRRWWATKGEGAWTQDIDGTIRRLHVSKVANITDAFLMYSSIYSWDTVPTGSQAVLDLCKQAWRHRAVGDFFGHVLVAEGAADACLEPNLRLWDMVGLELIVTEAGGAVWTNIKDGDPAAARIVVSSNAVLENPILAALKCI